jgi:methylenetetrahydrofolate dehydrogenase (NADP+)/methenyltetrahydrofolate cyclohydrolase
MLKIDGEAILNSTVESLKVDFLKINRPELKIVFIGNDRASKIFVEKKSRIGALLGIKTEIYSDNDATTMSVIEKIKDWQSSGKRMGIMVQLPLPAGINREAVIGAINPGNDVDGLRYCLGFESDFLPPVILAVDSSLKRLTATDQKKTVAVVGSGFLVGRPLTRFLKTNYPSFQVFNLSRQSENYQQILKSAEIVIGAADQPEIINIKQIKEHSILIDVGSFKTSGGVVGNIEKEAYQISAGYTPVPGGIGPMTIAYLYRNLAKIYQNG